MVEVLAQRFAVFVFSMRVNVILSDLRDASIAVKLRTWLDGGNRRLLRAEHNFIDLALAIAELTAHRNRPRNVARVAGALGGRINDNHFAAIHLSPVRLIMQDRAVWPGTDD